MTLWEYPSSFSYPTALGGDERSIQWRIRHLGGRGRGLLGVNGGPPAVATFSTAGSFACDPLGRTRVFTPWAVLHLHESKARGWRREVATGEEALPRLTSRGGQGKQLEHYSSSSLKRVPENLTRGRHTQQSGKNGQPTAPPKKIASSTHTHTHTHINNRYIGPWIPPTTMSKLMHEINTNNVE